MPEVCATRTPMFTATLFAIAKTWKQPKCPSIDEWIKKMWYVWMYIYIYTHTHNGLLLSHKKNEILSFAATWVDLEITLLSEVSQTKTNIILYHLYVESKKNNTKELIYKTETDSQT